MIRHRSESRPPEKTPDQWRAMADEAAAKADIQPSPDLRIAWQMIARSSRLLARMTEHDPIALGPDRRAKPEAAPATPPPPALTRTAFSPPRRPRPL